MVVLPKTSRPKQGVPTAAVRVEPAEDPSAVARQRLAGSSYPALRRLEIEVQEGVLTIRGCVPNFHMRQVAQLLVSKIPDVRQVVDRIHVT